MEQNRSTLLPYVANFLKKYSDKASESQLILRVHRRFSSFLTDGFFVIDTEGLGTLEQNTFVRVKK